MENAFNHDAINKQIERINNGEVIDGDKIEVYWIQQFVVPYPKLYIRYKGEGFEVSRHLVQKMAFDFEYGKKLHNNHVLLLKEALRFEDLNYIDFEMI